MMCQKSKTKEEIEQKAKEKTSDVSQSDVKGCELRM